MKNTDQLIGTYWTRVMGTHNQMEGVIDSIGSNGPRIKTIGKRHYGGFVRVSWAELSNKVWKPSNARSERIYQEWVDNLETDDFVDTSVSAEPRKTEFYPSEKGEAKLAATERPQNLDIPKGTNLDTGTKECHGAWHRHNGKDGAYYDRLPLDQFSIATRGPHPGQLSAICDSCKQKNKRSPSHKIAIRKLDAPKPIKFEQKVETAEGTYYRWKVTVVEPTEHVVQAKDFLDAAAQVAALGEVIRVEKL